MSDRPQEGEDDEDTERRDLEASITERAKYIEHYAVAYAILRLAEAVDHCAEELKLLRECPRLRSIL